MKTIEKVKLVNECGTNYEKAVLYASIMHAGQYDKQGVPYICHPIAVSMNKILETENEKIAAVLHDVIEDCDVDIEEFESLFGNEILKIVFSVSRNVDEKYFDFIERSCKAGESSIKVKIADIEHNIGRLTPEMKGMKKRYKKSLEILWGALLLHGVA